jgi:hypothetical protein
MDRYLSDGVIEPSKLPADTVLFVETNARIFEFQLLTGGKAIVRSTGGEFQKNQPCQIVGGLSKDGIVFADKIVKEKHLIIALPKGRHVTGLVRAASLQGPGWSYEMWQE